MATPLVDGAAAQAAKRITVSGTNLFVMASQYLGDATQWNRIAALNTAVLTNADGFVDPWIGPAVTLILPPKNPAAGNGGIFGL